MTKIAGSAVGIRILRERERARASESESESESEKERERAQAPWQHATVLAGVATPFAGPSERASERASEPGEICRGKVWFICMMRLGEGERERAKVCVCVYVCKRESARERAV
jgi:hypothetical protein